MEFIKPPPVWPSSKALLSDRALAFLGSAEPPRPAPDVFSLAYEFESSAIEHGGLLFYDMEPSEDEFSLDNAQTLLQFLRSKRNDWTQHALMLWCFWGSTCLWDFVTYLIIGNGTMRPKAHAGSRMSYRRLIKHERGHLCRSGFFPPLLRFLPLGWMILSSTIQVPHDWYPGVGLMSLPGPTVQSTAYWTRQFLDNVSDRVQQLDEMIMLNSETLIQYNQRKYHSLVDGMTRRLNTFGSDIIVGELESTVEKKTSNDEFFNAFVDLEPVATVDCHYDADEGQHFFDCEELEQELFDPVDVQSICVKRTVVDCVYETLQHATIIWQTSFIIDPRYTKQRTKHYPSTVRLQQHLTRFTERAHL